MHESLGKALCIKSHPFETEGDMGIVKILFVHNGDRYVPYTPESEAEDGIFITHSYESATSAFDEDEIFCVTAYRESDRDDWKDGSGYKKRFVSNGSEISALNKYEMMPVINCPLPDKKTGIIDGGTVPPINKSFFVRSGEKAYGPFLASRANDDSYRLMPVNAPSLSLDTDHIVSIDMKDLAQCAVVHRSIQAAYLPNLNSIKEVIGSLDKIDFISDKDLIRYFAKHGFGKNIKKLSKSAAKGLLDAIDKHGQQKNSYKSHERLERLKDIMDDYLSQNDIGQDVINDWANSKQGERFLDKYVQDNSSKLLNDRIAKLEKDEQEERAKLEARRNKYQEEHDSEMARLSTELEKLRAKERDERQKIDDSIAEYRQQTEKQKKEEIQKQQAELMAKIEGLEKQRDDITSESDELSKKLEDLRHARSLQSYIENLEFQKDSLVRTIETKDALLSDTNELRKLAIQDKTLKQLMSLNSTIDSDQKIEFSEVVCNENPATRPEDYIESIKSHLDEQEGRSLSSPTVA